MSTTTANLARDTQRPGNLFDDWARRLLLSQLGQLRRGELILEDASGINRLGESADLTVRLTIHEPRFFRQAVLEGTLGIAESYLRGDWDCDHLTNLFRIFARQRAFSSRFNRGWARAAHLFQKMGHWLRRNSRIGSRQNIAAHYDLGNDFYQLWLDETLAYSSAVFPTPETSLADASVEKFDRLCRQLALQPDDHLLEIGTGWGGFALHAAQNYGCRVTTTTISQAQHALAAERFARAGLQDRIELLQTDYRDLRGEYDKLVSIEMIEAVGHEYFDDYFRQCGQLLRPHGSFAIQAIVMPERDYDQYLGSVDFIQKYIFPGGCLPSVSAMLDSVGRTSDLQLVESADFGPHYAETLRRWRRAFHQRLDDVRALGYDERFIRMWDYYLCYCEAAFDERAVGVVQLVFDKPGRRRPVATSSSTTAGS